MGIWGGFALRSDLLCPRRQSKQSAAGGGHARFHRAIRTAPRPPVTRGTHDRQPFSKPDRRGKKHGLISACHSLPLGLHQIGQAVFLLQMRLVQAVFRVAPIWAALRNCTPRREGIESGKYLIEYTHSGSGQEEGAHSCLLPAPNKSVQTDLKGPS